LILLVAGGEAMVRGVSSLAARLGISTLVIGLTVVAFGTSAPELAVNVAAVQRGAIGLPFGNIFGSNLANLGLIVAVAALIRPLDVQSVVIASARLALR
jgi:cation:H+ antiporter